MSEPMATRQAADSSTRQVAVESPATLVGASRPASEGDKGRQAADASDQLRLRVDYWFKRLDHTLTHTQTSSRLIYLVDGTVLAMVYFVINAFGASRQIVFYASLPMLVLAALNGMHALLISKQHWWYRSIDRQLASLLGIQRLEPPDTAKHWWHSTHGIYQWMHWLIGGLLLIMACLMIAYGIGFFSELVLTAKPPTAVNGRGDR